MIKTTRRTQGLVVLVAAASMLWHSASAQLTEEATATNAPATAEAQETNVAAAVPLLETNAAGSPATAAMEPGKTGITKAAKRRPSRELQTIVKIGGDAELKAGDSADAVVVIGGSATVRGRVRQAVVVVGGDANVEGEVGEEVVAVMGNVKIGDGATVRGDVVSVGGKTEIAEGATVKGHTQEVDIGGIPLGKLERLKPWFAHCVLLFRPLAPQVSWVWAVAGTFFLIYFLITLIFPGPVAACVREMTNRPATGFLMGLLTKLLAPLVVLLLLATGIGALVVPFILAPLLLGGLLGKAAFLQFLGRQIGTQLGSRTLQQPLVALLLGILMITLLYLIPVVGFLTFAVTGVWGLGAAVMAAFGGLGREAPPRPAPAPWAPPPLLVPTPGLPPVTGPSSPAPPAAGIASGGPPVSAWAPGAGATPTAGERTPPVIPEGVSTSVPEALMPFRAGFWVRMGAAFLDVALISLTSVFLHKGVFGFLATLAYSVAPVIRPFLQPFLPLALLVALVYFSGMWTWRGTTIGGIVLNLKVVRHDGKPLNFTVALVRALAAAFSALVLFLGFFWIGWSREKQGWHDKIAGTVVVRQARGMPLICL